MSFSGDEDNDSLFTTEDEPARLSLNTSRTVEEAFPQAVPQAVAVHPMQETPRAPGNTESEFKAVTGAASEIEDDSARSGSAEAEADATELDEIEPDDAAPGNAEPADDESSEGTITATSEERRSPTQTRSKPSVSNRPRPAEQIGHQTVRSLNFNSITTATASTPNGGSKRKHKADWEANPRANEDSNSGRQKIRVIDLTECAT